VTGITTKSTETSQLMQVVEAKIEPIEAKIEYTNTKVDTKEPKNPNVEHKSQKNGITNPDKNIDPITVKDFSNLKYKYFFEYNGNKINPKKGDFKRFVRDIEKQLKTGRKRISINVYSSSSTVPTITHETNEKLSKLRAENIKYDIQNYFQENTQVSDQITVTIKGFMVAGPTYKNDGGNRSKYRVYQYVEVITE
jgi:outer membrane protein OmpA-like peptidoglycan-associated protein